MNKPQSAELPHTDPRLAIASRAQDLGEGMNVQDRAFWGSLARELHDGVTQEVWYLQAELSYISDRLSGEQAELRADLDKLTKVAQNAYKDLRSTLDLLHARSAAYSDISSDLKEVAQKFSDAIGMEVTFESTLNESETVVVGEVARHARRLVQEALWNSRQHSKSEHAKISLRKSQNGLAVTVSDDGCGFSPADVDQNHYGLRNMRERAEAIHGKLYVTSGEGKGTLVTLHIPIGDLAAQAKENN